MVFLYGWYIMAMTAKAVSLEVLCRNIIRRIG